MTERRTDNVRGPGTVRVDWMPGIGLLAAAVGAGAVLGYTTAAGRPPVYLSLTVCALIVGLAVVAWRRARIPVEPARTRERASPHASRPPQFDLSRDRSTDAQKYIM